MGSGPAGLTTAIDLRREGHEVVVYEAFQKAGGVMVYGIPEFRLPKALVATEAGVLADMGVRYELNFLVGRTRRLRRPHREGRLRRRSSSERAPACPSSWTCPARTSSASSRPTST